MKGLKNLKGEWKNVGPSVYESANGDRIHTLGMIRIREFNICMGDMKGYYHNLHVMGGNHKRALMLTCENFNKELTNEKYTR